MKTLINLRAFVSLVVIFWVVTSCKEEHIPSPIPPPPTKPVYIMHKGDSLAMVDIYNKINGKENLPGWDLKDWYTWGGVTVAILPGTNTIRVTQINLGCNYDGVLSEKVGDLEILQIFSIYGKGLRGTLPESFCKLKHIREIRIGSTNMSGKLPDEVFSSPALLIIDIGENEFSGSLPTSLVKLGGRVGMFIHLGDNKFTGAIPKIPAIYREDGVTRQLLILDYNNFTEIPFDYLFDKSLAAVTARMNRFSGEVPQDVLDAIEQEPKGYTAIRYYGTFWNEFQEGYGFTNAPKVNP